MKILFAVQATGNGHISRAREVIPHLRLHGELDVLISGRQAEVALPTLIKYKKSGISFTFGKRGGIDIIDSIRHFRPFTFLKDIYQFPVKKYDLIINDFEPVTAWACKLKKKTCIALSHQASFLSPKTPRPNQRNAFAENIFRNYAPVNDYRGFHFKEYDKNIFTPVIRSDIRKLAPSNKGHITVYLPAHSDPLILYHLKQINNVKWQVFSKSSKQAYSDSNVSITPVNNDAFTASLATGDGLLTAGGFESPAEAIFLRKKVFVIPMIGQYEQACNAEAMKELGITVVKKLDETFTEKLRNWVESGFPPNMHYPDITGKIIEEIIAGVSW